MVYVSLHLLGIEDSKAQASSNGNGASDNLRHWECLTCGKQVQGDKDDDALEGVTNGGGHRSEGSKDLVLHLIVHVKAHAAQEEIFEESTLVGQSVEGGLGALDSLEAQNEGHHQQRRKKSGDSMLVGRVEVSAVLEIVGKVLAQDRAQSESNIGAHGHNSGLGCELLAHDLGVQVSKS